MRSYRMTPSGYARGENMSAAILALVSIYLSRSFGGTKGQTKLSRGGRCSLLFGLLSAVMSRRQTTFSLCSLSTKEANLSAFTFPTGRRRAFTLAGAMGSKGSRLILASGALHHRLVHGVRGVGRRNRGCRQCDSSLVCTNNGPGGNVEVGDKQKLCEKVVQGVLQRAASQLWSRSLVGQEMSVCEEQLVGGELQLVRTPQA